MKSSKPVSFYCDRPLEYSLRRERHRRDRNQNTIRKPKFITAFPTCTNFSLQLNCTPGITYQFREGKYFEHLWPLLSQTLSSGYKLNKEPTLFIARVSSAAVSAKACKGAHYARPGNLSSDERSFKLTIIAVDSFGRLGESGEELFDRLAVYAVGRVVLRG